MGSDNTATTKISENQSKSRDRRYAGLIPFSKGQSGNPGGKPKGTISIAKHLQATATKENVYQLVKKLWLMAHSGDLEAAKLILERVDGKVKEQVEMIEKQTIEVILD